MFYQNQNQLFSTIPPPSGFLIVSPGFLAVTFVDFSRSPLGFLTAPSPGLLIASPMIFYYFTTGFLTFPTIFPIAPGFLIVYPQDFLLFR